METGLIVGIGLCLIAGGLWNLYREGFFRSTESCKECNCCKSVDYKKEKSE